MFFPGMFKKSDAPVTTPAELAEAVGMTYDTYTGKRVSSQKAMRLTAVFGCIRVLAESMGMLPCNLYKITGNSKQKATSERLHKLLTMKPNDYMTPQEFWELVIVCLCLRGNFYAYKVKALGEVVELLPIDPGCVEMPVSARCRAAGRPVCWRRHRKRSSNVASGHREKRAGRRPHRAIRRTGAGWHRRSVRDTPAPDGAAARSRGPALARGGSLDGRTWEGSMASGFETAVAPHSNAPCIADDRQHAPHVPAQQSR